MSSFLIGIITAFITFAFSYSYLSAYHRVKFNIMFGNPITDIIITLSCLLLVGTTASSLMTVLGLGIGLSSGLRIVIWFYGKGDGGAQQRLKEILR